MDSICSCWTDVRLSSRFIREKYSSLPRGVSKEGWCKRLCTPKFMATAPAAAPHRNTSVKVTIQATLGSQDRTQLAFSSRLGLIGGHRGQHVFPRLGALVGGRILLRHHGFGGEAGGVFAFVGNQITAQRRQRHQRRKHQSAPEGEIQGKKPCKGRHRLAMAHRMHHSRVKPGGRRKFLFHFERAEPLGDLLHTGHFPAARLTTVQVRLDIPQSRRLQRAGQVLLKAFHDYDVHKFLPYTTRTTTPSAHPLRVYRPPGPPASGDLPHFNMTVPLIQPATRPGARSRRCAAFTSFCRARNSFTLMVFSFIPVWAANSSTENPSTSFIVNNIRSSAKPLPRILKI